MINHYSVFSFNDQSQISLTNHNCSGLDNPVYSESYHNGGPRLATVMIWLSGVEEGGRTVFDGAGVSVETRPGSALLWWNIR